MENQKKDYRKIFLEKCENRKIKNKQYREKFILKSQKYMQK